MLSFEFPAIVLGAYSHILKREKWRVRVLCSFNQGMFFRVEQAETNSEMLKSTLNDTVLPVMHKLEFVHSCPLRYHAFSKLSTKKA